MPLIKSKAGSFQYPTLLFGHQGEFLDMVAAVLLQELCFFSLIEWIGPTLLPLKWSKPKQGKSRNSIGSESLGNSTHSKPHLLRASNAPVGANLQRVGLVRCIGKRTDNANQYGASFRCFVYNRKLRRMALSTKLCQVASYSCCAGS